MASKKSQTLKKIPITIYLNMQNSEERAVADAFELLNSAKLSEEAKAPIIKCIKKMVGELEKKLFNQRQLGENADSATPA